MKYIDLKTVVNSYQGFQNCMTNKSWGYLAILRGCNRSIRPSVPYEVDLDVVSNFLENIFNLSQNKRQYDSGRSLYVVFSNQWDKYFNDQGRYTPNIYDVAVWAYRRKAFSDSDTREDIINRFSQEFNIPSAVINNSFNVEPKNISFTDVLYSESDLKTELREIGVDVSRDNIDAKKVGVVASPGETSRGPFIQPLYAGLDISDYVLILQSNYTSLYGNSICNVIEDTTTMNPSISSQYLTAIRTKPFLLLAGISGTGKSRMVREFAFKTCPKYLQDKEGTTPGNYCMIEVKPNWHDSTELLGYYSNLSGSYQFKKFVKFLVKAKMFPEVPFFVCLDEMNLAPVEQYFAEILSILETRKHPKTSSGEVDMSSIKTDAIIEGKYFKELTWKDFDGAIHTKVDMTDKDWYETFFDIDSMSDGEKEQVNEFQFSRTLQKNGLTLPDNVIIIGTVNMDDTTHQFSRKVIDRAMTIEMNGGKLVDMFGGSKDLEYIEDEEEQKKWQHSFSQRYVTADEVLEAHPEQAEAIKKKLPERLDAINMALKGTPFEVSYRVLNELTIMVGVMLDDKKEGDSLEDIINQAVNNILLMKILPRIEGDAEMFALSKDYKLKMGVEQYNDRLEWLEALAPDVHQMENTQDNAEEEDGYGDEDGPEIATETQDGHAHYQTAKEKIQEMIDRLNNQDFTRFWP